MSRICPVQILSNLLIQVRELTQNWMKDNNELRAHEALGDLSPIAYFENMKIFIMKLAVKTSHNLLSY